MSEKSSELRLVHLTAGHSEVAVANSAEATNIALDSDVVGWISEDHRGPLLLHQRGVGTLIESAAAKNPVLTEYEEITGAAYRWPGRYSGKQVGGIFLLVTSGTEALDPQIDLTDFEAGRLEIEIEV